ncbi:MAG: hypothetical protein JXA73_07270 [Acidobacteria bacterium]|nr:hypothetical protein [Acidobacteriota bacterium]
MTNLEKQAREYDFKCWEWGQKFDQQFLSHDQVTNIQKRGKEGLNQCIRDMQIFLQHAANDLLYGNQLSIKTILSSNIRADFDVKIGLVSGLRLVGIAAEDKGIPLYQYLLGQETEWISHIQRIYGRSTSSLKVSAESRWSEIQASLFDGVSIGERVFGLQNASGVLLSHHFPNGLERPWLSLVPIRPSKRGAAAGKFKAENPWALVDTQSFPQVYTLVSLDTNPLGFLQLVLRLPPHLVSHTPKYIGPEAKWLHIYDPNVSWVKLLARLSHIFSRGVLAQIVARTIWLRDKYDHARDTGIHFPDTLRGALALRTKDNNDKWYSKSLWANNIAQVHSLLEQPAYSPAELAINLIDSLWIKDDYLEKKSFGRRAEAERVLFWTRKYREHLVHTVKVFLLGERILHEMYGRNTAATKAIDHAVAGDRIVPGGDKKLMAFEQLWMRAATIHDYSLPFELLPNLQHAYWHEFVDENGKGAKVPSSSTEKRLEQMHFGLALTDHLLRQQMIVNLWHVLHADVLPSERQAYRAYDFGTLNWPTSEL